MATSGIQITWEWWQPTEKGHLEPAPEDIETLNEHALERAMTMIQDGFVEGDLNAEEVGAHERNYCGYWKRQIINT